jgi:hypothetical protein
MVIHFRDRNFFRRKEHDEHLLAVSRLRDFSWQEWMEFDRRDDGIGFFHFQVTSEGGPHFF